MVESVCCKWQCVSHCYILRRWRKMYCGHARLCVCVSVCMSVAVRPHYCTDPDVTWGRGRGCPLVMHYWADLQSGAFSKLRAVYGKWPWLACRWLAVDGGGGVLNITAVVWTAGFSWWRSGNIMRTQNVSECMLILALCLVPYCKWKKSFIICIVSLIFNYSVVVTLCQIQLWTRYYYQ